MVTVPVCTTDWPAKSLLVGTSVQVPFMARWSAAMAEHVKSRVVKTAAVMVVEYVLMITFQGLLFSTEAGPRTLRVQPDSNGPRSRLSQCRGRWLQLGAALLVASLVRFPVYVLLKAPVPAVVFVTRMVIAAFAHTLLVCLVVRVILFVLLLLLLFVVLGKWSRHGRCSPYADAHTHHYRQSPDTVFQIRIHRKFVPSSWKEHAGGRSGGCGPRPGERHGPVLVFLYYSSRWPCRAIIAGNKVRKSLSGGLVGLRILLFLCLPVGAAAMSGAFLYTEAPRYDVQAPLHAGDRFPGGARVLVFANGVSRPLAPSLVTSADPALSPDAQSALLSGRQRAGEPWQIWEVPLAGGPPRQLTSGTEDCIRPFYGAEGKFVYARQTARGFQIEIAALQGGTAQRLTWMAGDFIPDGIMRDGRVLFEAAFPAAPSTVRDLYTVYTDGSGVETRRCDHGPDPHSAAQLRPGASIFPSDTGVARFTSARAGQMDVALPKGQYVGPVAELEGGEWLATYRAGADAAYWICQVGRLSGGVSV